jgi:hypothetical protein
MAFPNEFWHCVGVLSTTLKQNSPLVGSGQLTDLVADFQQASSDDRETKKHDLGILIARLIQIDRTLHEHVRSDGH